MTSDFSEIVLERYQRKMLKHMLKKPLIRDGNNERDINDLYNLGFVEPASGRAHYPTASFPEPYRITQRGRLYLQSRHRDLFRFWFPTVLSIIAILVSIVAITANCTCS